MNVELNGIYGALVAVKEKGLIIRQHILGEKKRFYQYVYIPFNCDLICFVGTKKECEKESLIKQRRLSIPNDLKRLFK